jgi:hypothetical protein
VQHSTVAPASRISSRRCCESRPPPGIITAPILRAPSTAAQKPMKGPKAKAMNRRSEDVTPAPASTWPQQRPHQSQDSWVSITLSGTPVVPEVWCMRT